MRLQRKHRIDISLNRTCFAVPLLEPFGTCVRLDGFLCMGLAESRVTQTFKMKDPETPQMSQESLGHMVGIFDGHRGTSCADYLSQDW